MRNTRIALAALVAATLVGSAVGCYGYGSPNVYVGVAVPGPYVGYPYPYHGPYGGWVGRPYPSPYPRYDDPEAGVAWPTPGAAAPAETAVAADTTVPQTVHPQPAGDLSDSREN